MFDLSILFIINTYLLLQTMDKDLYSYLSELLKRKMSNK